MAAMMSPLFRVAEYQVEEYNGFPIRASWQFDSEMEIEGDNKKNSGLLFAEGCAIPSFKSISFSKPGNFSLSLHYDQEMPGVNSLLAQYELKAPKITEKEFKQKIRVKLGQSGLVELTEYLVEETYYEEVPVKVQ